MWEHRDLCPVCIHCIGGFHFREQLWEEEIHNPYAVLKPTDVNKQNPPLQLFLLVAQHICL